jgi:hypothetical protein
MFIDSIMMGIVPNNITLQKEKTALNIYQLFV